jgi:hypothetical protein
MAVHDPKLTFRDRCVGFAVWFVIGFVLLAYRGWEAGVLGGIILGLVVVLYFGDDSGGGGGDYAPWARDPRDYVDNM